MGLLPPMISPFAAIPAMGFLVYVPHLIKGNLVAAARGKYDNVNPREQHKGIKGEAGKRIERALAAHQNSWESLTLFSIAILMCTVAKVPVDEVSSAATLFLAARAAYIPVYIWGSNAVLSVLRSVLWGVSVYTSFQLMLKASWNMDSL